MPAWKRTLGLLTVVQFSSALGFSIIFPFLPLYSQELRTSSRLSIEALSGLIYSVPAITMAIASPFWGAVADRYGRKPMVVRAGCGGAVIILLMGFVQTGEQLVILRAIQGLVTGIIAACSALVAAVTPRERTGYAMGLLQLGLWCGVSTGPLIGGALSDWIGFRATFVVTAIILFLSGLSVWIGVEEPFVRAKRLQAGRFGFVKDCPGSSGTRSLTSHCCYDSSGPWGFRRWIQCCPCSCCRSWRALKAPPPLPVSSWGRGRQRAS